MTTVHSHLHGALNDFLPAPLRGRPITRNVHESPAVKDVIESLGVPHVEVDVIVADGRSVDFSYRVRDGMRLDVYPAGAAPELSSLIHLVPPLAPDRLAFACDGHLARLAAYLRMLGFDTWHENHADDRDLADLSAREDRILLTQDRGLLRRAIVRRGYAVRAAHPPEQLHEVVVRFGLAGRVRPFTRCLRCNGPLESIDPVEARRRVPPRVAAQHEHFRHCPACDTIYWPGSHHARMRRLIDAVAPGALAR